MLLCHVHVSLQVLTSAAYVFCKHLEAVPPEATHSTSIAFPLMQDTRPISADWPALAISKGDWIYFVAQIQYAFLCMLDLPISMLTGIWAWTVLPCPAPLRRALPCPALLCPALLTLHIARWMCCTLHFACTM